MADLKNTKPARKLELIDAYRRTFSTEDGMLVLEDLRRFCFDGKSAFKTQQDGSFCVNQLTRHAARQEVVHRINEILTMDEISLQELIKERASHE